MADTSPTRGAIAPAVPSLLAHRQHADLSRLGRRPADSETAFAWACIAAGLVLLALLLSLPGGAA